MEEECEEGERDTPDAICESLDPARSEDLSSIHVPYTSIDTYIPRLFQQVRVGSLSEQLKKTHIRRIREPGKHEQ